jgi:hypothetical protein
VIARLRQSLLIGASEIHYGVLAVQADTLIDHEARVVLMTNLDVAIRFPGQADAKGGRGRQ